MPPTTRQRLDTEELSAMDPDIIAAIANEGDALMDDVGDEPVNVPFVPVFAGEPHDNEVKAEADAKMASSDDAYTGTDELPEFFD